MEHVISAFLQVTSPLTLLTIAAGVLWGVLVGALPGLGSVLAITICLPFTYALDNTSAISLLIAVYCGSVYGGCISAILINTPGTPQSAATCFDGYPMAQQGKANLALGWATLASVFGGLFSCVVLIVAGPSLARFALRFGPVETFALILMALTCISTVSRGSTIKGLLAGVLGLFIAVVGSDPMTGDLRFTFGYFTLSGGFDLIPMVIGIFALSEVFARAATPLHEDENRVVYSGMVLPAMREWKGRLGVAFKSSLLGSGIGILPGTGAATAAFISYAEAKRSSPRKENMGKGEPDGIIAAEAANNAVTGGALVPTLALGLPGDSVTAVMLATLVIHGITPGVRLMVDNPVTVNATFIGLAYANLLLIPAGLLVAKFFAKILRMPEPLLMALVVILCLLGAYGVRSSSFDVMVAVATGVFGFALRYFGVSLAPMVIGLVLGPTLEISMRQGLVLTDMQFSKFFVGHPIAVFLFALTLCILFWPLLAPMARKALGR